MTHTTSNAIVITEGGEIVFDENSIQGIVSSEDPSYLTEIASKGAVSWAYTKAIAVAACYRQKQLFEQLETRETAVSVTGHTSWSAWLTDLPLPVSDGWVRQRCVEINEYLKHGADWDTILSIVAYGPTAGTDVLNSVVGPGGELMPHIDPADLPGGSVAGLLEAIAAIPDPGQARKLVSDVAGKVTVYARDAVVEGGCLHMQVVYERPNMDDTIYVTAYAMSKDGERRELPEAVGKWMANRLGATLI